MNLSSLYWVCSIFLVGSGVALDLPFVFNETSSSLTMDNFISNQIENISASSELAGVPPISNPPDNEIMVFSSNCETPEGKTYRTVGEFKKAFKSKAWREKGVVVLFDQGRYEEALLAFTQAIKLDPKCADNWNAKGIILNQNGQYDETIKCFRNAIALKPSFSERWKNKAVAHSALGKYREAEEACYEALMLNQEPCQGRVDQRPDLWANADIFFPEAREPDCDG